MVFNNVCYVSVLWIFKLNWAFVYFVFQWPPYVKYFNLSCVLQLLYIYHFYHNLIHHNVG